MIYLSMIETEDDKITFEHLYIEYRERMYDIAYDILGNDFDAEDAVHQAFVNIAKNFTKISQYSCKEMQRYIVIISRNAAIDIYNHNKNFSEKTIEYNDDMVIDDSVFEDADYSDLKRAIELLSSTDQDVMYLFYFRSMPAKEIAKRLNISVSNVWTRLHRARAALKKNLERGENDE